MPPRRPRASRVFTLGCEVWGAGRTLRRCRGRDRSSESDRRKKPGWQADEQSVGRGGDRDQNGGNPEGGILAELRDSQAGERAIQPRWCPRATVWSAPPTWSAACSRQAGRLRQQGVAGCAPQRGDNRKQDDDQEHRGEGESAREVEQGDRCDHGTAHEAGGDAGRLVTYPGGEVVPVGSVRSQGKMRQVAVSPVWARESVEE